MDPNETYEYYQRDDGTIPRVGGRDWRDRIDPGNRFYGEMLNEEGNEALKRGLANEAQGAAIGLLGHQIVRSQRPQPEPGESKYETRLKRSVHSFKPFWKRGWADRTGRGMRLAGAYQSAADPLWGLLEGGAYYGAGLPYLGGAAIEGEEDRADGGRVTGAMPWLPKERALDVPRERRDEQRPQPPLTRLSRERQEAADEQRRLAWDYANVGVMYPGLSLLGLLQRRPVPGSAPIHALGLLGGAGSIGLSRDAARQAEELESPWALPGLEDRADGGRIRRDTGGSLNLLSDRWPPVPGLVPSEPVPPAPPYPAAARPQPGMLPGEYIRPYLERSDERDAAHLRKTWSQRPSTQPLSPEERAKTEQLLRAYRELLLDRTLRNPQARADGGEVNPSRYSQNYHRKLADVYARAGRSVPYQAYGPAARIAAYKDAHLTQNSYLAAAPVGGALAMLAAPAYPGVAAALTGASLLAGSHRDPNAPADTPEDYASKLGMLMGPVGPELAIPALAAKYGWRATLPWMGLSLLNSSTREPSEDEEHQPMTAQRRAIGGSVRRGYQDRARGGDVMAKARGYAAGGGPTGVPGITMSEGDLADFVHNPVRDMFAPEPSPLGGSERDRYMRRRIAAQAMAGRDPNDEQQQWLREVEPAKEAAGRNLAYYGPPGVALGAAALPASVALGAATPWATLLSPAFGLTAQTGGSRRNPDAVMDSKSEKADAVNAALAMSMPLTAKVGAVAAPAVERALLAAYQNPGKVGATLAGVTSLGAGSARNRPPEAAKEKPGTAEIKAREADLQAQLEARARLDAQMAEWTREMQAQGSNARGGPGKLYNDLLAKIGQGQKDAAASDVEIRQSRKALNDLRDYWSDKQIAVRAKEEERQWRGKPMAEKFEAMTGLPSSTMPFAIGTLVSAPIVGGIQSSTNRAYNTIVKDFNKAVTNEDWAAAAMHQNALKHWEGLGWKNSAKGVSHILAGGLPLELGGGFRYGYDIHRDPTTEGGAAFNALSPTEKWVDYAGLPLLSSVVAGGTGWKIGNAMPRRMTEYGRAIAGLPPGGSGQGGPGGAGGPGPIGGPTNPVGPFSGGATLAGQYHTARAPVVLPPPTVLPATPFPGGTPASPVQGGVLTPVPDQTGLSGVNNLRLGDYLRRSRQLGGARPKPAVEPVAPEPVTPAPPAAKPTAPTTKQEPAEAQPPASNFIPAEINPVPVEAPEVPPVPAGPLKGRAKTATRGRKEQPPPEWEWVLRDGKPVLVARHGKHGQFADHDHPKLGTPPPPPETGTPGSGGNPTGSQRKIIGYDKKTGDPIFDEGRTTKLPGEEEGHKFGGRINRLIQRYARGGRVYAGLIAGATGGRTDALPVSVPAGAYIIPADCVSALGQGNTLAGSEAFKRMCPPPRKVAGHSDVPIRISDGEIVVSPDQVMAWGGGNLDAGHRRLDQFVKQVRAEHIRTLQSLPGPAKS